MAPALLGVRFVSHTPSPQSHKGTELGAISVSAFSVSSCLCASRLCTIKERHFPCPHKYQKESGRNRAKRNERETHRSHDPTGRNARSPISPSFLLFVFFRFVRPSRVSYGLRRYSFSAYLTDSVPRRQARSPAIAPANRQPCHANHSLGRPPATGTALTSRIAARNEEARRNISSPRRRRAAIGHDQSHLWQLNDQAECEMCRCAPDLPCHKPSAIGRAEETSKSGEPS